MSRDRRWPGRVAALLSAVAVGIAGAPSSSRAAEPVIRPVAGGLGAGMATNVSQTPRALGIGGGRLFVVDGPGYDIPPIGFGHPGVIWGIDLVTGRQDVVAGSAFAGYAGDGGPAVGAHFGNVEDVAIAPDGTLYIADGSARIRKVTPPGTVTTFAGTGEPVSSGDGGAALHAGLRWVTDLAVGVHGDLYLSDQGLLRHIDGNGTIRTVTPTPAAPDEPPHVGVGALAMGPDGSLYMADAGAYRVRKMTPDGRLTTVAGNGVQGFGRDGEGGPARAASIMPTSLALGPDGALYIGGPYNVRKVGSDGVITTVAGQPGGPSPGDGLRAVDVPTGQWDIAVDGSGNLYIADYFANRVRKVDTRGIITTFAGNGHAFLGSEGALALEAQIAGPARIAVGSEGLTIEEPRQSRIRRVGRDGIINTILDSPILGMARDDQGNVYVNDLDSIRKVSPSGQVSTVGTFGGPVAVDATGALYVYDLKNPAIRRIDPLGIVTTVVHHDGGRKHMDGEATPTTVVGPDGSLWWLERDRVRRMTCGFIRSYVIHTDNLYGPQDLVVDGAGRAFVSSQSGIVRIDPRSGVATTVVGGGTQEDYAGKRATSADLWMPHGMAVDGAGRLLFADRDRVWAVDGIAAPVSPAGRVCTDLPDRVVRNWGWDGVGLRGDGTADPIDDLTPPNLLPRTVAVAAGAYHSLALREDGTVWGWGWNGVGQLGDGTTVDRAVPVQVRGLTGVKAISAGAYHSLAVRHDGTVWAWGWNPVGQLGNGSTIDRHTPAQVLGLGAVTSVSGGGFHSLALRGDGSVWAWGWNGVGQLGDGTRTDRHIPVRLVAIGDMTAVSAGAFHSLAVHRSKVVASWGWNGVGQLGIGSTTDSLWPVGIPGLSGVTSVAAGGAHSLALLADGTARGWGWNAYGQVGDETTTDRHTPVPVKNVSPNGVTAVAAGTYHSAGIDQEQAMSWGYNGFGEAALWSSPPGWVIPGPFHFGQFPAATAMAAGGFHSLGIWDFRGR